MDTGVIDEVLKHKKQFHDSGVGLLDREGLEIHVWADRVRPARSRTRQLVNERALTKLPDDVRDEIDEKATEVEGSP